jgi:hypothetical protein
MPGRTRAPCNWQTPVPFDSLHVWSTGLCASLVHHHSARIPWRHGPGISDAASRPPDAAVNRQGNKNSTAIIDTSTPGVQPLVPASAPCDTNIISHFHVWPDFEQGAAMSYLGEWQTQRLVSGVLELKIFS